MSLLMSARCRCPACGAGWKLPETALGRTVCCGKCKQSFVATTISAAAPSAEAGYEVLTDDDSVLAAPAARQPPLGWIGRFELQAALGQGAYGRVYRAYDPTLDREVALKVPRFS